MWGAIGFVVIRNEWSQSRTNTSTQTHKAILQILSSSSRNRNFRSNEFNTELTMTMALSNLYAPQSCGLTPRRNDRDVPVGVGQLQVPLAQLLFMGTEPCPQRGDPRRVDSLPLEPPQPFRVNTVAGLQRAISDALAMIDDEDF
jgi:hypothetical protein